VTEPPDGNATARRDEEEWLKIQYQMAHHDIWWVKAQQIKAGNWTLLLLAALVGVGKLMHDDRPCTTAVWEGWLLGGLGTLVTALGALYVWDLNATLVRSRKRATLIVQPLLHSAFDDPKRPAERSLIFPVAITFILVVALGLVWWHFSALCQLKLPTSASSGASAASPVTTSKALVATVALPQIAGFGLAAYGVLRQAFADLAQPRPFGEGRWGEGTYGGVSRGARLLVSIGTKLRLLPGDHVLTVTDRQRNAACAIAGTALYVVFFVLDDVLRYLSAP
jgi:hypothetical protein